MATPTTEAATLPQLPGTVAESRTRRVLEFAASNKLLIVSGAVILIYILVSILAPLLAPYNPLTPHPGANYLAPGGSYLGNHFILGTDKEGRDVLSRIMWGGRATLVGAGIAMLIASGGGFILGLTTAYVGGWFDRVLMRVFDLILCFSRSSSRSFSSPRSGQA